MCEMRIMCGLIRFNQNETTLTYNKQKTELSIVTVLKP